MLWHTTISKNGFRSRVLDNDEASTGKWIVPITIPDIRLLWEEIEDAAVTGRLVAVKKSTAHLRKKIGHDLVCVYCSASDVETAGETLNILREIGFYGELKYKSDKATFEWRDEYLYSSTDFDGLGLKPF